MAKYSPEIVEKITELIASDSYTIEEICKQVGINRATYFRWQDEKQDFRDAVKKAKAELDQSLYFDARNSMRKIIRGYEYQEVTEEHRGGKVSRKVTTKHYAPNPGSVIFALKQDGWVDRRELDHSGEVGVKNIVGLILDESEEDETDVDEDSKSTK